MKACFLLPLMICALFAGMLYFFFLHQSPNALPVFAVPFAVLVLLIGLVHREAARFRAGQRGTAAIIYSGACGAYLAASVCGELMMTAGSRLNLFPAYQQSGAFIFGAWLLYLVFQPFAAADALLAVYACSLPDANRDAPHSHLPAACIAAAAGVLVLNLLSLANF